MKKSSIPEFERLYGVNIPMAEELDYYLSLLSQSKEYDFLPETIKYIENLELTLSDKFTLKNYKTECMDYLIDYIGQTKAYEAFQKFDLSSLPKFQGKDLRNSHFANHNEQYDFISLDIVSANYSVLQHMFDKENELCYDWRELCAFKTIHPALRLSKSFRQYVFGNLNPKRSQTIQQSIIMTIVELLSEKFYDNIIYITHDEIMFKFVKYDYSQIEEIKNIISNIKLPIRLTPFRVESVKNKSKIYVKNILNDDGSHKYRTLFGVPGNQFYFYYKKYIIQQPVEIRDLYFWNDNKLAIWVMNPEYEKVDDEIINAVLEQTNL